MFIPFPKPSQGIEKCQRWIVACCREDLTVKNRNRNTYICALHWPGEKGPTEEFPDPLKANLTPEQVKMASAPKRKAPTIRSGLVKKEKAILSDELGPLPIEPEEPSDKGESLPSDSEEQKESESKDIVKLGEWCRTKDVTPSSRSICCQLRSKQ